MQQMFGTDNHYIQDDGRGHEIIFVPFGLRILVRTLSLMSIHFWNGHLFQVPTTQNTVVSLICDREVPLYRTVGHLYKVQLMKWLKFENPFSHSTWYYNKHSLMLLNWTPLSCSNCTERSRILDLNSWSPLNWPDEIWGNGWNIENPFSHSTW